MQLTPQQQALLDGAQGETMAKVVKTLVMYGDTFGAQRMVPVTSEYGHTVISFGLAVMKPVYDLYDRLIESGLTSGQKFTADPLPLDKHVPTSLLEDIVFRKIMYTQQDRYEQQLKKLGITADNAYTCTCYLEQVGNTPKQGDILSWAESSAVVYANSVLGARCNRNSGMLELMGSIAGFVPEFGLLTDEGRKAHWLVEVKCTRRPEAQLLGSAIGMKVMEDVPYVRGLDKWLGTELNDENRAYLKDFGAATASNGAVGLYHVEHLEGPCRRAAAVLRGLSSPDAGAAEGLDGEAHRRPAGAEPPAGGRSHRVHRCPGGAGRLQGHRGGLQAAKHGRDPQLHLPADVHEQPHVQEEGGHHQFQQAAHLYQRPVLHGRGDTGHPVGKGGALI